MGNKKQELAAAILALDEFDELFTKKVNSFSDLFESDFCNVNLDYFFGSCSTFFSEIEIERNALQGELDELGGPDDENEEHRRAYHSDLL